MTIPMLMLDQAVTTDGARPSRELVQIMQDMRRVILEHGDTIAAQAAVIVAQADTITAQDATLADLTARIEALETP